MSHKTRFNKTAEIKIAVVSADDARATAMSPQPIGSMGNTMAYGIQQVAAEVPGWGERSLATGAPPTHQGSGFPWPWPGGEPIVATPQEVPAVSYDAATAYTHSQRQKFLIKAEVERRVAAQLAVEEAKLRQELLQEVLQEVRREVRREVRQTESPRSMGCVPSLQATYNPAHMAEEKREAERATRPDITTPQECHDGLSPDVQGFFVTGEYQASDDAQVVVGAELEEDTSWPLGMWVFFLLLGLSVGGFLLVFVGA